MLQKKAVNTCIINEGLAVPDAVTEIDSNPKPDVPMLMFVSDGRETGVKNWKDIQNEYSSDLTNAEVIELDWVIMCIILCRIKLPGKSQNLLKPCKDDFT